MHTEWGDWSPQPAPNRTDGEPSQAETQPATATDTQGRSTSRRRIYSTPESRAEFAAVLNLHAHPRTAPPHGSKEHTYQEQRPEGGTPSSGGGHPNHEQQQQAQASDLPASSDNNPEPQQQAFSSTDTAPQPTEQQPRTNTGPQRRPRGSEGEHTRQTEAPQDQSHHTWGMDSLLPPPNSPGQHHTETLQQSQQQPEWAYEAWTTPATANTADPHQAETPQQHQQQQEWTYYRSWTVPTSSNSNSQHQTEPSPGRKLTTTNLGGASSNGRKCWQHWGGPAYILGPT